MPQNAGYDQLADVIAPSSISIWGDFWARIRLYWYRLRHGAKALQHAVSGGQYSFPDGLFYGGDTETWSRRTMEDIIGRFVSGAKRVIFIDIHTGLGPYAKLEVITDVPKDSPEHRRDFDIWGDMVKTTHTQESASVHMSGPMKWALRRMLTATEITAVSLEFGTFPGRKVFWALREENWLYHHGSEAHADRQRIKTALLRVFYPADSSWRQQVWEQGSRAIDKALTHLVLTDSREVSKGGSGRQLTD